MLGEAALGAAVAFCLAAVTTPVGVSGAVFLIPFQISVAQTPSPAVTPTNLLYNLVAIPGALLRFRREGRLGGPLTRLLLLGAVPGVLAGAVLRVTVLDGTAFLVVVAAVLAPLGAWLAFGRRPPPIADPGRGRRRLILGLALATGTVGGVYGIGGGSILGPLLVGLGYPVLQVAPAALAATFVTSLAGVAAFALLSLGGGDAAPEWALGLGMGLGGLAGAYLGARLQPRLPEALLRRGLGLLALALGARYALQAIG